MGISGSTFFELLKKLTTENKIYTQPLLSYKK